MYVTTWESEIMFHLLLGCVANCPCCHDFFCSLSQFIQSVKMSTAALRANEHRMLWCGRFTAADSTVMSYKWDDEQFWPVVGGWRVWEKKGWQWKEIKGNTSCSSRWCTWGYTVVLFTCFLLYHYASWLLMFTPSWLTVLCAHRNSV